MTSGETARILADYRGELAFLAKKEVDRFQEKTARAYTANGTQERSKTSRV